MKRIWTLLFKLSLRLLPSYLHSSFANKIKNFFARRALTSVGGIVNFGTGIKMSTDIKIGDDSGIGNNAFLTGPLTIGDHVMMGANVTILRSDHQTERTDIPMTQQGMKPANELVIEDDVWLCDRVFVLPSVTHIGKGSILAACAVVTKNVPDYAIVAGNPAKVVKYRIGQEK